MRFQELIEADKPALMEKLRQNAQLPKAVPVLEDEFQRLLIRHNEAAGSETSAERAASAIRMIRYQLPLILSADQAKIWQSETPGTKKENGAGIWMVLFMVGVFFMLGALLIPAAMDQQVLMHMDMRIVLIMLAAAAGLFLAACLLRGAKFHKTTSAKKEGKDQYVEVLIDPDKTYSALRTMMVALDKEIEDVERAGYRISEDSGKALETGAAGAGAAGRGIEKSAAGISEEELELFCGLLEAEITGDGGCALEQLGNVRFYLHRLGIEAVDYTQEHDSWFEKMPSAGGRTGIFADHTVQTIRPALVKDGKLLKAGVAAGN